MIKCTQHSIKKQFEALVDQIPSACLTELASWHSAALVLDTLDTLHTFADDYQAIPATQSQFVRKGHKRAVHQFCVRRVNGCASYVSSDTLCDTVGISTPAPKIDKSGILDKCSVAFRFSFYGTCTLVTIKLI